VRAHACIWCASGVRPRAPVGGNVRFRLEADVTVLLLTTSKNALEDSLKIAPSVFQLGMVVKQRRGLIAMKRFLVLALTLTCISCSVLPFDSIEANVGMSEKQFLKESADYDDYRDVEDMPDGSTKYIIGHGFSGQKRSYYYFRDGALIKADRWETRAEKFED
jgi:hypothetical protein